MTNSMKKIGLAATTILLTSTMATSAFAWGKDHDDRDRRGYDDDRGRMEQRDDMGHGNGMMKGQFGGRMVDALAYELVLDADTKAKVKTLFDEAEDAMDTIHDDLRDLQKDARDIKPSDGNYVQAVTENAQKRSELQVQSATKMAETKKALYALLTPEQITKLEAIDARGMMGGRGGKHH